MNNPQNAKRSINYEFEMNNSKLLAPVVRYKGHSRLYQLNISKMLLKCPDQLFCQKQSNQNNPQQLIIVSTQKYDSTQRHKHVIQRSIKDCKTDMEKAKMQRLRKNIKESLQNNLQLAFVQEEQQYNQDQKIQKIKEEEDNRTAESPNITNTEYHSKHQNQSTTNSSKYLSKNVILTIKAKKMYDSALEPSSRKQSFISKTKVQVQQLNLTQNNRQHEQISQIKQKQFVGKKFSHNNQIMKRSKISKKLLLPQIKSTVQDKANHTYNVGAKSNIPLLFRDPEQLKHIKAEAYSVIQYPTGNLLLSNKGLNQYQIASLTKIMTFYTAKKISSKYSLSLSSQKIKINDIAMDMSGTSAEILSGQVYTVEQLLYGLMLPSGNDAAIALAQWAGKHIIKQHNLHQSLQISAQATESNQLNSIDQNPISWAKLKAFINEMNLNAKQLGLNSTRFANPHGLPNSQAKSTSTDVARLCFQCLKDELFRKIIATTNYRCVTHQYHNPQIKRSVEWINTNKLLRRDGFLGIKTGITVTAGPCFASAYQFRDKIYISVVLRANKISRRFKDTRKLLAWSIQKYYGESLTNEERKILNTLKKNKPQLDSDYSEDEQQFNYDHTSKAQFKKRSNIINYQM